MAPQDIPEIGFGTARFPDRKTAENSVREAIEIGYRHIDTAQHYQHTEAVGTAIQNSSIPRSRLLIASKLHSKNLGYDSVISETESILERIALDTLDLLYVHWPAHAYDPETTFAAMDTLCERGKVRHIGVCNFTPDLLREAIDTSPRPILANQIEMHPFLSQDEVLEFCLEEGLQVVAHSPFADGLVFDSEVLQDLATKYDATVAQVVLAWLLDRASVSPIPKATGDHIEENYNARNIDLERTDIERIESIEGEHRIVDYEFAPWNR